MNVMPVIPQQRRDLQFQTQQEQDNQSDVVIEKLVSSIAGKRDHHNSTTGAAVIVGTHTRKEELESQRRLAHRLLTSSLGLSASDTSTHGSKRWSSNTATLIGQDLSDSYTRLARHTKHADAIMNVLVPLAGTGSATVTKATTLRTQSLSDTSSARATASGTPDVEPSFSESSEPSAILILRECLYALQGMNGQHVYMDDSNVLQCPVLKQQHQHQHQHQPHLQTLGSGAYHAIREYCEEVTLDYHRIQSYLNTQPVGSVERAFQEAVSNHLHVAYHLLLADMDSMLQRQQQEEALLPTSVGSLSLRQMCLNLPSLHSLAIVVNGCVTSTSGAGGGALLTGLHRHAQQTGHTKDSSLMKSLLSAASQPWYHSMYLWTTKGILTAGNNDFMIQQKQQQEKESEYSHRRRNVWHSTFVLNSERVPSILPPSLVPIVFSVGKSVHFIRTALDDAGWNMSLGHDDDSDDLISLGFHHSTASTKLARTLLLAQEQVNQFICTQLYDTHDLISHLHALKQFLFLGQGDFHSVLMELLYQELEEQYQEDQGKTNFSNKQKDAGGWYDYVFMGLVDTALKSSNASQLPPYVLSRLYVKLRFQDDHDERYQFGLPSPNNNDENDDTTTPRRRHYSGWDIFSLEYNIPEPLQAIIHEDAMEQYHLVFAMLFRLKRVEFMLHLTWRQSTALHHAIQLFAQYNAMTKESNLAYAQATLLLRRLCMTRQCMMHFITHVKSYLFFEVLEGAYKTLLRKLEVGSSLQDYVDAHDAYLKDIIQKSLLGDDHGGHDDHEVDSSGVGAPLQTLLQLALDFCTFQQDLFRDATHAVDVATKKRREAERRSKEGDWGFVSKEEFREQATFFGLADKTKLQHVVHLGDEFNTCTKQWLVRLHELSNGTPSSTNNNNNSNNAGYSATPLTSADSVSTGLSSAQATRDQFNHDSLQFLMFQLDYNGFYHGQ